MQSELLKHEEVISFPESHFFRKCFLSPKGRIFPALSSNYAFWRWAKNIEQNQIHLKYRLGFSRKNVVRNFIRALDEFTLSRKKTTWVEKTPAHLHAIEFITQFVPDALFLHVLRDGRDVVASLYEATKYEDWNGPAYSIETAIERYNQDVSKSREYIGSKNHIFLRYEDLIMNPSIIKSVFDWIGVDPSLVSSKSLHQSIVTQDEPWKDLNKSEKIIDTRNRKFKKMFTEKEQMLITKEVLSLDDKFSSQKMLSKKGIELPDYGKCSPGEPA